MNTIIARLIWFALDSETFVMYLRDCEENGMLNRGNVVEFQQ